MFPSLKQLFLGAAAQIQVAILKNKFGEEILKSGQAMHNREIYIIRFLSNIFFPVSRIFSAKNIYCLGRLTL